MTTKEIITLQFGHFSNFVGTHIWNVQEAYFSSQDASYESAIDHSVLFRSVQTKHGDSYEPRLVLFDLQGSFGALKKGGEVGEAGAIADTWSGQVETYKQEEHPQNPFLQYQSSLGQSTSQPSSSSTPPAPLRHNPEPPPTFSEILDSSVQVWSDYSKLLYHRKSIVQLPIYSHENETTPFILYAQGRELWDNLDLREEVIDDRIRFFLEDCDSLQGFQILTNTNDGFGGLASVVIDAILEDMPKATLMTYGINEAKNPVVNNLKDYKTRMWENLNQIQCVKDLKDLSSVYIPICSPLPSELDTNGWSRHLRPKFHLRYHTSAYLASLIETASLPFRTYSSPLYMYEAMSMVSPSNITKIAALAGAMPLHHVQDEKTMRQLLQYNPRVGHKFNWMRDCTFRVGYDQVDHENGEYAVLRGLGCHLPKEVQHRIPNISKQQEALNEFCASFSIPEGHFQSIVIKEGLPISDAFPQMFNSDMSIAKEESVLVRIRTPSRVKDLLESCIRQVDSLSPIVTQPLETLLDVGYFKELKEDLQQTADVYNEAFG